MDTPQTPVVETPADSPTDSPADAPVVSPEEVPAEAPVETEVLPVGDEGAPSEEPVVPAEPEQN